MTLREEQCSKIYEAKPPSTTFTPLKFSFCIFTLLDDFIIPNYILIILLIIIIMVVVIR